MTTAPHPPVRAPQPSDTPELTGLARIWADLVASGWHEDVLRYASHALLLAVLALTVWVRRWDLAVVEQIAAKASLGINGVALAAVEASATPEAEAEVAEDSGDKLAALPPVLGPTPVPTPGGQISRRTDVHTLIPTRSRAAVLTYTVQSGDTLFGIADRYGLQPETVLWGNYFVLRDDPHLLVPGQVLNILPVDGTYHLVTEGNTIEQVAEFYDVEPQAILDWPGNELDPTEPALIAGQYLVVPGGQRELQTWEVPTVTRTDRAAAAGNFGQCPGGYSGAVGSGVFGWPADNRFLSGYDFTPPIHRGLDIRAPLGAPIYAADSGVIVYAGPNDRGYGYLVMIDHGNGWVTLYAHLSQWNVVCGQSVFRGAVVGLSGSTGNSSGPHLHFETRYNSAYINPWTVLP